jgi:hypothetical protein
VSTPIYKLLLFLKRNPALTVDVFRDYYENVHSKLALKYDSGNLKRYVRRYVEPLGGDLDRQAEALDFDVVTELWFEDKAAFDTVVKFAARGKLPPDVVADEERVFDRAKIRYVTVVEHETELARAIV